MTIDSIKEKFQTASIFHTEGKVLGKPTVIAYQKKFKWTWMATQLNTFVVATDFGSEQITVKEIEDHLTKSFEFAKKNYKGWPRGLQSGLGVISILISSNVTPAAIAYCKELKSGKKWAGFSIPVIVDLENKKLHRFDRNPLWGAIYYPHFKKLIDSFK
jgi:hypothetical protein